MDGKKVYQIEINGVKESVAAVESLNKQLNELENRIKALEKSNVKVGTSSSSGGGSKSSLSEEERLQKEINKLKQEGAQLDAKIAASQDEIYKRVDATKQLYKETIADQKAIAAQERLTADAYSNTMVGMKQKLADIKSVIQTTDLGDSDKIKQMTQEANGLTTKLKEMEEAYGQFGRNVGNYKSAADGFKGLAIQVGDVTKEFDNAKQALKELKKERDTLSAKKDMGLISEEEAKRLEDLIPIVAQLKSSIQDAGKPMDALMDTMQSIVAIAQTGKGIAAFFGVDDDEIQRSIQKLVALQNAMQGLQTIQKQLQTREGIGAWIVPFTTQIDKATAKLLTFNTALLGTSKAAKVAAVGIKTLGKALKGLATLGIMVVIEAAIEKVMDLVESFNKLSATEQAQKDAEKAMSDAYGEGMAKLTKYKTKLDSFNGSKKEEKKIVEELNKEFGSTLGTYKSIAEWQDVLNKKGQAYIETLKLQAKAQAALNAVTAAYANLMQVQMGIANGDYDGIWNSIFGKSGEARLAEAQKMVDDTTKMLEDVTKEQEKFNKENKLGDYAPQIQKNGTKSKNALEEVEKTLNSIQLKLMRDGLNKKLRQLDEEERQTLNKLRENGIKTGSAIQKIQRAYNQLREKEIKDYLKGLEDTIKQSARNIENIEFQLNISKFKNDIDEAENEIKRLSQDQPIRNTLISKTETKQIKTSYKVDDNKLDFAKRYNQLLNESKATDDINEFYKFLTDYIKEKDEELYRDVVDYNVAIYNEPDESKKEAYFKGLEETYKKVSNIIESEYGNELLFIRDYTDKADQTLSDSLEFRIKAEEEYNDKIRSVILEGVQEQAKLNKQLIEEEAKAAREAESDRYNTQMSGLTKTRDDVKEAMKAIEESYKFVGLEGAESIKETNKEIYQDYHDLFAKTVEVDAQIETAKKQHKKKLQEITREGNNKIKENETNTANAISEEVEKSFDSQIQNIRDAQSKINELLDKQPVINKLGIVNLSATKKQYNEIVDATKKMTNEIIAQKLKLDVLWAAGLIKPEAMNAIKQQLNDLEQAFRQLFQQIENEAKDTIPKFIQTCQVYVQGAMDSFQTIMSAVWDAQDTAFDKEQDQIDKMNEELDKKLSEQQEIVQQHKSTIDSIEDELATARGSRRQHLIDQINAEISAQKAAQKQEQKIQKEKEKAQKKQDELEKKRRKAQYQRDLIQAIVNGAMAVTYAAMNVWPVPAIPMMALAAATTAAQVAIMSANKPYAKGGQLDGGVAQGKRHRDGGIKVLGGRAEIEGGEFVTNRITTEKNIDILDYINSKHKKLTLDDFVDFYGGSKVRNNILSSTPKRVFADGGVIPTLNNEYSFDDRLLTAFEDYSNRPVVVSVVDINKKQADVRRVQTLAGL